MNERRSTKQRTIHRRLLAAACLGAVAPAVWAQTAAPAAPTCHDYDRFISRGSESPIISTCETLSPNLLGWRPKMFDHGWMLMGSYSAGEAYDLRGQEARPQQYNGQYPSFSGSFGSILTYDLSRLDGWGPRSQLTVEVNSERTVYRGAGIDDHLYVAQLSVEQEFAAGRVRLQYGYYGLLGQFYGLALGTSTAASVLGPTSIIPNLVGMTIYKPVPGADIRLYSKSGRFYDHFGVARSQSPGGFLADSQANPSGLKWSVDGARPIYVNEIGYRIHPSADHRMTWIRQGTIYNRTHYFDYATGYRAMTRGFYLAGDHQFYQPDPNLPYRGWYLELRTDYAPPETSAYTADYAITLYSLAPFAGRPGDMLLFGYAHNKMSHDAQRYLIGHSHDLLDSSATGSVAYALRAGRGVYWLNTLSYTREPVFIAHHPDALVLQTQLTFSF